MTLDNVEVVLRAGVDTFNRRDPSAIARWFHEDAEFHPLLSAGTELDSRTYKGHAQLRQYLRDVDASPLAGMRLEVVGAQAVGEEQVIVEGRAIARGEHSGVPVEAHLWLVFEVRDEKIAKLTSFLSDEDARAAIAKRSGPVASAVSRLSRDPQLQ